MLGEKNRDKWIILGVATYCFIIIMINFSVFPVIVDDMSEDIGLKYTQIGLLMSIFTISYAFIQIPSGITSDRLGGSKIAFLSVLILGFSGFILAFTPSYRIALIARMMMGLSAGLLLPSTMKLLPRWFEADEYNKAMGIFGSSMGIALSVTLLSIPLINSILSWRGSLTLVSILTLTAAAFSAMFLRDKERIVHNPLSSLGLDDVKKVVTGKLLLLTSLNVTSLAMFTGVFTWLPLFLIQKLDFTLIEVGYVTAIMGVMMVLASGMSGVLSKRLGGEKIIVISMTLCVVTPLLLAYSSSVLQVFIVSALIGWASMFYFAPTFGAIPKTVKSEYIGMGFGILNTLTFIGASVTPTVTGYILEYTHSFELTFITIALISLLGLFGSLKLVRAHLLKNS